MASAAAEALEHLRRAIQLLHQLGFLINFKKLVLTPAQSISFLGFRAMEMRVPPKKIRKLRQECTKLLLQPRVTVRTLACRLGRLTSLSTGLLTAPLRYRHLQELKILALRETQSYEVTVQWTSDLWEENFDQECRSITNAVGLLEQQGIIGPGKIPTRNYCSSGSSSEFYSSYRGNKWAWQQPYVITWSPIVCQFHQ